MRVRSRISDEHGATAVMFAILLVVFIAVLALATDGGLLFVKYRQVRRANDAAALAAAINCVKFQSQGTAGANAAAGDYAAKNVTAPTLWADNEYPNGCVSTGGKVIVHYGASQSLSFGPAIGISSPKQVTASSTATWGFAGGVQNLIPLTLAEGTELSKCTPGPGGSGPAVGAECKLFWDGNDSANGKWGIIDMRQLYWNTDPSTSGCNSNGSSNLVNGTPNNKDGWMAGVSGSWFSSVPTAPNQYVYVCAADGGQGNSLTSAVNEKAAYPAQDIVYMPVFRPSASVISSSSIYKFAVIGFAGLRVVQAYQGQAAADACGVTGTGLGNSRCLVASWQGYSTGGTTFGGTNNFGPVTVALTG